jgi:hypothetical protein
VGRAYLDNSTMLFGAVRAWNKVCASSPYIPRNPFKFFLSSTCSLPFLLSFSLQAGLSTTMISNGFRVDSTPPQRFSAVLDVNPVGPVAVVSSDFVAGYQVRLLGFPL